jgi:hypothetical protein
VRAFALALSSLLLSQAPLQCSHEPEGDLRKYETPPEALYDLATRFKSKHDDAAWRDTLVFLVERYPSSRFAERAKAELGPEAPAPGASSAP